MMGQTGFSPKIVAGLGESWPHFQTFIQYVLDHADIQVVRGEGAAFVQDYLSDLRIWFPDNTPQFQSKRLKGLSLLSTSMRMEILPHWADQLERAGGGRFAPPHIVRDYWLMIMNALVLLKEFSQDVDDSERLPLVKNEIVEWLRFDQTKLVKKHEGIVARNFNYWLMELNSELGLSGPLPDTPQKDFKNRPIVLEACSILGEALAGIRGSEPPQHD